MTPDPLDETLRQLAWCKSRWPTHSKAGGIYAYADECDNCYGRMQLLKAGYALRDPEIAALQALTQQLADSQAAEHVGLLQKDVEVAEAALAGCRATVGDIMGQIDRFADVYAHTTWLAPLSAEEGNRIYRNIAALLKQLRDDLFVLLPPAQEPT